MCFLALCVSSLEKYIFRFSAYFFIGFFFIVLHKMLVYFLRKFLKEENCLAVQDNVLF